jgi:cytochrome c oxidase subunit III
MAHAKNHDYHIIPPSILPFLGALGGFTMLFGAVLWMHSITPFVFLAGIILVIYVMFAWWSEVVNEGQTGDHTPVVRLGLRYGFILFIMSEVMFFLAWFWTFFKHALYPMGPQSPAVDGVWPPAGIETFDPWHLPLINTLILLCSGAAATWAHHAIAHDNNRRDMINGLALAVGLGLCFTVLQAYEYSHAAFGFAGNIYGVVLHGDRVPRIPRRHRDDFPCGLHVPRDEGALHAGPACGLRSGGLVLALCRCGLAVPVRGDLCLGQFGRGLTFLRCVFGSR